MYAKALSSLVFVSILLKCIFFLNFIVSCGNFGSPYKGYSSPKSSATHSYQCVQYFRVSTQWYGCQCLGFLTCTQMLMHAIAHGGCTDTVRKSALKLILGEIFLAALGTRTRVSTAPCFSEGHSVQLSYSHSPLEVSTLKNISESCQSMICKKVAVVHRKGLEIANIPWQQRPMY